MIRSLEERTPGSRAVPARAPRLADLPAPPRGRTGWPWTVGGRSAADAGADDGALPVISIVTPSYNQAPYLEETIRSVLLQGYPNLEYIVMDGGSSDGSLEIIERYAPWITHWTSERDGGQAQAINRGMRMATGGIVAYLNSDDVYCPGALELVARLLPPEAPALLVGAVERLPDGELMLPGMPDTVEGWIASIAGSFPQPACFWRRAPNTPAFDESLSCVFDRAFFMELLAAEVPVTRANRVLAQFRLHDASKTSTRQPVFLDENMRVNWRLLPRVPLGARRRLATALRLLEDRQRLHAVSRLDGAGWRAVAAACASSPHLLLRRELYGKLRRLIA